MTIKLTRDFLVESSLKWSEIMHGAKVWSIFLSEFGLKCSAHNFGPNSDIVGYLFIFIWTDRHNTIFRVYQYAKSRSFRPYFYIITFSVQIKIKRYPIGQKWQKLQILDLLNTTVFPKGNEKNNHAK